MKNKTFKLRLSDEELKKLEELAEINGISKSEIIRILINKAYQKGN